MSTRITTSATPYDTLPRRYTDLAGRRIGQLTVQRLIRKHGTLYWECLCDCGNHCLRRTYQLTGPHPNHTDRAYTAGKLTALALAIHETDTMLAALRATNTSDGTHHA